MAVAAQGPRLLLRRLREIMAEQTSAQTRLDKLVTVIATNMVAEVCSIYLRRAGKALELFATEGLNREGRPQHADEGRRGPGRPGRRDRRAGQSLRRAVRPAFLLPPGDRRRPLQVLPRRPHRARRPGVRRPHGAEPRRPCVYAEEEVEALQTVLHGPSPKSSPRAACSRSPELDEPELRADRPRTFHGEGLSEGVGVGRVVLHEPRVKVERMIADNPQEELTRLEEAIGSLRDAVDPECWIRASSTSPARGREVIEAYRLFAHDQGWRQRMRDAIRTGLTAEAAVERVQDEMRVRVQRLDDPVLRERLHDLDDLARRLHRHLTGRRRAFRSCRQTPSSSRARHGPGGTARLSPRPASPAWCWKKPPRPAMSPSSRAR
ncbi:MAG: phosphoenolpyruvate-utilizing N-terminal domain-containing protein [Rhizomicrobium sp.]